MKPGDYPITLYAGDTYYGGLMQLPSLVPFGGPSDLAAATVVAQIGETKDSQEALTAFTVNILDATARELRLTLTPEQTAALPRRCFWDLEVTHAGSGWEGTPLAGRVTVIPQVVRS